MNCDILQNKLGFTCRPVSDSTIYIESPITMMFDGDCIGAYVQDIGRNRVRISDNADMLFNAQNHDIAIKSDFKAKLQALAGKYGLELNEAGEIAGTCDSGSTDFMLGNFIELSARIGHLFEGKQRQETISFERKISKILERQFNSRLQKKFEITGASGHQLRFPFALDAGTPTMQVIQPIPTLESGVASWQKVYESIGKMTELKKSELKCRSTVILERPASKKDAGEVKLALSEVARIITYNNDSGLIRDIAA